ncbi:MAG: ABC transporter permease, partial [Microthrixaceae bacterium]|nr:ABC transporter permease [Microthrixaceae bacterium]
MRKLLTRLGRLILVVVVVTFLTQLMTEFVPGSLDQILAPFSSPE